MDISIMLQTNKKCYYIATIIVFCYIVATFCYIFATSKLIQLINSKIEDKKAANYLSTIVNLVGDSVKTVYQTYVESLKNQNIFTEEAQKEALDRCMNTIKAQLAPDLINFS